MDIFIFLYKVFNKFLNNEKSTKILLFIIIIGGAIAILYFRWQITNHLPSQIERNRKEIRDTREEFKQEIRDNRKDTRENTKLLHEIKGLLKSLFDKK